MSTVRIAALVAIIATVDSVVLPLPRVAYQDIVTLPPKGSDVPYAHNVILVAEEG